MTKDEFDRLTRERDEYADQLRYVWDNIASEVYAFSECHCDVPAGETPCAYCASEHFCNWFREHPELTQQ